MSIPLRTQSLASHQGYKCPVLLNCKGLKVSSSQPGRAVRSIDPKAFSGAGAQRHRVKFWCPQESPLASGMLVLGRGRHRGAYVPVSLQSGMSCAVYWARVCHKLMFMGQTDIKAKLRQGDSKQEPFLVSRKPLLGVSAPLRPWQRVPLGSPALRSTTFFCCSAAQWSHSYLPQTAHPIPVWGVILISVTLESVIIALFFGSR